MIELSRVRGSQGTVGFTVSEIPGYFDEYDERFYHPYVARLPVRCEDVDEIGAQHLADLEGSLAIPSSIVWAGEGY